MHTREVLDLQEEQLRHVLLIYRKMIPSIRLCGHCQMEYLAQQGKVDYRAVQEMKLTNEDLNWADIVLLGRLDSWYEYQLTKLLHESGRYLIYIIDDDLLNIPPEISSAAYYGQKEIQGYIRGMMEMSDAILSPSPLLLEKYAVNGKLPIQIEEPAIAPVPYKPHDPNKPVKIGFAGSIDRTGDIENILKDALLQIKREYGERVEFEFFGAIPSFAKELDARCIPYCDSYDEYRRTLNSLEWDIGLAPMPDTPFHACKHYNKFVEYAGAGVVGIFSKVQPYLRISEQYSDAILVENVKERWYDAIDGMLKDRQLLERHRAFLCEYFQRCLLVSQSSEQLLVCTSVLIHSRRIRFIPLWLIKGEGCVRRGLQVARRYGIRTIGIVRKKFVRGE
ncbi:MAG: hypothetical protein U0J65_09310 [Christensenellales bacterium]|nr:hypothetical protein [Christensenellales bacterium]